MSPPSVNQPPGPGLPRAFITRRSLLAATGIAAGIAVVGTTMVPEDSASAASRLALPYRHPFVERWVILKDCEWGNSAPWRSFPPHAGVDYNIAGGSEKKTIRAIAAGTIRGRGWSGTYGNRVYIQHDDGMWSHYAHMYEGTGRSNGEWVNVGDPIGRVGNTGSASNGAHLHLELATSADRCHSGHTSIDPIAWIDNHPGSTEPEEPEEPEPEEILDMYLLMAQDTSQTPAIRWAVVAPGYWYVTKEKTTADGLSLRAGAQINVTWAEWDAAFQSAVSSGFVPATGQTSRTI